MKRLVRILLFVTWLIGAATGGFTAQPGPPTARETAHVVAESDLGRVTVRSERIVLAVQVNQGAHWRIAAPAPSSLRNWLRASPQPSPDAHPDAAVRDPSSLPS